MDNKCKEHQLGMEVWGRDDQTVQLKCLACGAVVSVDDRDYYEEMQRLMEDDTDDDPAWDDDDDELY